MSYRVFPGLISESHNFSVLRLSGRYPALALKTAVLAQCRAIYLVEEIRLRSAWGDGMKIGSCLRACCVVVCVNGKGEDNGLGWAKR